MLVVDVPTVIYFAIDRIYLQLFFFIYYSFISFFFFDCLTKNQFYLADIKIFRYLLCSRLEQFRTIADNYAKET